jgi:hypothetical protein
MDSHREVIAERSAMNYPGSIKPSGELLHKKGTLVAPFLFVFKLAAESGGSDCGSVSDCWVQHQGC